jgi:predicted glycosyltransferase
VDNPLKPYELGLITIETMLKNGITVWASDENIRYKFEEGINKDDKDLLLKILKTRKPDVFPIISNPEAVRKTLCEGQEALSKANDHAMVLLDLLDRLERIYRAVHPTIKECINGENGCPDDSIVFCTACSTPAAKGRKENAV